MAEENPNWRYEEIDEKNQVITNNKNLTKEEEELQKPSFLNKLFNEPKEDNKGKIVAVKIELIDPKTGEVLESYSKVAGENGKLGPWHKTGDLEKTPVDQEKIPLLFLKRWGGTDLFPVKEILKNREYEQPAGTMRNTDVNRTRSQSATPPYRDTREANKSTKGTNER